MNALRLIRGGYLAVLAGMTITAAMYWPGLHGGWLFDDYPNILENPGVQPSHLSVATLVSAALSSPASDFKRPLASLSFAVNYLATGLDPFAMKLSNLVIHLLNGLLVFILTRKLLRLTAWSKSQRSYSNTAALTATAWLLLPINLTSVLYVVQRMESLANLFVMIGLIGYVGCRERMLAVNQPDTGIKITTQNHMGIVVCALTLAVPAAIGALAKETAIMLPLYALLIEWIVFRFRTQTNTTDRHLIALYILLLFVPMIAGLAWLMPHITDPLYWSTRDFSLRTRLLSETRIVMDYIAWTLVPTPQALSFYHDNFNVSTGIFSPWTTFFSILALISLTILAYRLRSRRPLITLGIGLYLGCHLLTGTILPLELVYEHRNYFASMGLMLAVIPLLSTWSPTRPSSYLPYLCAALLTSLLILWGSQTLMTAIAWGEPLRLAEMLASRAPDSPRAEYELGRTYIIYSHYDPSSPYTRLAYAPLERAAALPKSSVLPEQALIFMNSRMKLPLKDVWWDSLIAKLQSHKATIQDESSLGALTQCARQGDCELPKDRMNQAYLAAIKNSPSPRLLSMYADFAWNILQDRPLGERMASASVSAAPNEPAYHITLARMFIAEGQTAKVEQQIAALESLNLGGRLDDSIAELKLSTLRMR